jgi:RNA polymerase sigma-70 factor (ECF subfamily)
MSTPAVTAAIADRLTMADPADVPWAESRETPDVQALVAAARTGSCDAFGDLVRLNQRVVFRTALAALGSREDAEDAAQEAFVVAWQKLPGFRGDATFRTWLLTIVWRKALDRRRTRRLWWLRTESGGRQSGLDPLEHVAGALPDPEDTAITRDLARRLAGHIAGLSQKLRDTLLLAASGEHSYSEISVMLGIPLGTVKWRVTEARRILTAKVRAGTGTNI